MLLKEGEWDGEKVFSAGFGGGVWVWFWIEKII